MTTTEKELIKKLHAAQYKQKGMYSIEYGVAKKMGHSYYPFANNASTTYGGGRRVATMKHVRKHWTVQMVGKAVHGQTFKTMADGKLFIATELDM